MAKSSFLIYFSVNFIVCQEELERGHILEAGEEWMKILNASEKKRVECEVKSSRSG
jgi:hypothetical protein